ncbi:hypothetical protein Tco_1436921 [Tanacetum coccineum]
MSNLKFVETHNLVAFLEKPKESDGFEGIIDFLNASSIRYILTVNPTIYTTCIEQFWSTAKVKTVNGERQIQALVNKKKVIITEMSIRSDLKLEDAEGTDCLPTATIFAELERMEYENLTQKLTFYKAYFSSQWKFLIHTILQCLSAKTIAWNEFSSTMASAIICLATNQKFNFSKYIFYNIVKNLEGKVKFLMYPRFVQVFLDNKVEGMTKHKGIYVTPSHTKKVVDNMKRLVKGFSGKVTPLFQTMMVQAPKDMGEDSAAPTNSHSTPIITQPSSSKSQKKYLQENVLDLEKAKIAQEKEIAILKKREDASKQGRKIDYLDADTEVTLIDETQERNDEEMLIDVQDDLQGEKVIAEKEVAEKEVSTADPITIDGEVVTTTNVEVTTSSTSTTTIDVLTLVQTPIEIKAAKPKAVTIATTTTTTTRPKARGVVVQEPIKDKGKRKIVELEKSLKKKDQIALDEELALRLQAEEQAELEKECKKKEFQKKKLA